MTTELVINNLTLSVGKEELLRSYSNTFRQGKMHGIVGHSGAGKSLLLASLAGQTLLSDSISCSSGNVALFEKGHCDTDYSNKTGYLAQQPSVSPYLTVREQLVTTALFAFPSFTQEQAEIKADKVIDSVMLSKVKDSVPGAPKERTLSTGEIRRLALALEIIRDPLVLIVDEPTTGIDFYQAKILVNTLKNYANQGKIVIFSIHCPASALVDMIDEFSVLSQGKHVFSGNSTAALEFLSSHKFCSKDANIVESLIALTHPRSETFQSLPSLPAAPQTIITTQTKKESTSFSLGFTRVIRLFKRENKSFSRDKTAKSARISTIGLNTILICLLFSDVTEGVSHTFNDNYYNRKGLFFFYVAGLINNNAQLLIRALNRDKELRFKEIGYKYYSHGEFLISRLLVEAQFHLICSFFSGNAVFFYIQLNFNRWMHPFHWWGGVFAVLMAGSCVGLCLAAMALREDIAISLHSYVLHLQSIFSGSFLQINSKHALIFRALKSISLHFMSFRLLFYVEFEWFNGGTCDYPDVQQGFFSYWGMLWPLLVYCGVFLLVALVIGKIRFELQKRRE